MNAENRDLEAIGTIVGIKGHGVVVQLDDGSEVTCRGMGRIHRMAGCFCLRDGQRYLIRYTRGLDRMPLLIEPVVDDPVE